MSSEAITRNDLTAILNEVLPPTPSEYRKLLWTNPNPNTTFAAQTVSLDLTDYDAIDLEVIQAAGGNPINYSWFTLTKDKHNNTSMVGIQFGAYPSVNFSRDVYVTNTGIAFDDARYKGTNSTSAATVGNGYNVPNRIYGIKYERVNPPQVEIADVVIEQGSNSYGSYRKWDSGTMEQWGAESSASTSNHTVTLPVPFASNNYIVLGTNTSGTQTTFMMSNTNASYFYVYPSSSTRLFWTAIGKWK